ncbi:extracellular solute-binding protein [Cellulomonas sp. P24]|uniref:sugar ABC transporter substrate-binding protein n=1 Tax=Cellulomonas sp. P24 TaxID=2885206 RepID=UPI00216B18BA|nr:extracellular solute-binding protein [Cellulomonas sp. P24]MCR6494271.1 extracellular solute-binding protein [Cellulomonas sp. P24]
MHGTTRTQLRSRRRKAAVGALGAVTLLALAACGSSGSGTSPSAASSTGAAAPGKPLTVLIGSSGDAETTSVTDAVAAWSKQSGTQATVKVASDLGQELTQGFASGQPADVFYVGADSLQGYASNGSLLSYGDQLPNTDDFYKSLRDQFTYNGKLVCAPKDFSTLALVINTDDWAAAGLTDADIPTTWDQLSSVAKKLTTAAHVGLGISGEYARLDVFMAQAGGTMESADGKTATVDSPENLAGLNYIKGLLKDKTAAFAKDLGTGWGGEAFGTGKAAMTIEGNWITGAMSKDYPNIKYKVVELPAGPAGKATLQFTNCWGVAADSGNKTGAVDLVKFLTSKDQQLAAAKAFGVMPSIKSAAAGWSELYPNMSAFITSAAFAKNVVNTKGSAAVITDFNSQLGSLATADPKAILASVQKNLQAAINAG